MRKQGLFGRFRLPGIVTLKLCARHLAKVGGMAACLILAAVILLPATGSLSMAQGQPVDATQPVPARSGTPSEGLPPPVPGLGIAPPTTVHPPLPAAQPVVAQVSPAQLPHDLSPWAMFKAADIVVKAVMTGLALASVATWTIWLAKALELTAAKTAARRALARLEKAESLDDAAGAVARRDGRLGGAVGNLLGAALTEMQRSVGLSEEGTKERVAIALGRLEVRAGRGMARGTGLLATIGSTAPFVGLFGTVWGIMNSFIGISQAKTTNLAVVAPGIAEALLATAIGLVAAIPAVIIYNVFSRAIAGYRATLSDASGEILRHLSRDLERRRRAAAAMPAAAFSVQHAATPRVPAE